MNAEDVAVQEAFRRHVCQTSPEPLGIVVEQARGAVIRATDGHDYIDLLSGMGVANVGHAHPDVLAAIERQSRAYLHVAVYGEAVQRPQVELARRLSDMTPGAVSVVYFTNSGTEAMEGALKTARKQSRRSRFIAFDGAFHGDTFGALSLCGNRVYREPFEPLLSGVERLPFDDVSALERIDEDVAAVVVEPVQAEGGVRIPGAGFLPALRQRCTEAGALLIVDEVLTGFGRTGRLFACQHWQVDPDILVLAKALGGGMPLGAFVGSRSVMETLSHDPPLAHVTTFGGHPVSCAAGGAALDVLLRERLSERAARLGARWLDELRGLIGGPLRQVRGVGMLLGLEFEEGRATQDFVRRCFDRGLVVNWTLHCDTVVRLAPPLVISEEELWRATEAMAASLRVA
jgi:acetylornithine/succinyldiaminopimelate/putrescine aminotransferase